MAVSHLSATRVSANFDAGLPPPPPLSHLARPTRRDVRDDEGDTTLGELARFFLGALAATATGAGGGVRTVKSPYCELLTFSGCNVMSFSAYHPLTLRWSSQKCQNSGYGADGINKLDPSRVLVFAAR